MPVIRITSRLTLELELEIREGSIACYGPAWSSSGVSGFAKPNPVESLFTPTFLLSLDTTLHYTTLHYTPIIIFNIQHPPQLTSPHLTSALFHFHSIIEK